MMQNCKRSSSFERLLRNSGWNLLGLGAGLLVAIAAIPLLLKHLGPATFGLFTIFLALIGYSGLLDLGIGRAITADVARQARKGDFLAVSSGVNAALTLLAIVALLLSAILIVFSEQIASVLVGESIGLHNECNGAVLVLSLTVPVVLLASGIRGALEGLQEFKAISKIAMPTGMLMFIVPTCLSMVTTSIAHLMWSLLTVRLLALALLYVTCKGRIISLRPRWPFGRDILALLRAGGWITVSNIVSPLMNNLDRLFISAQLTPSSATLYVTPYELATKALFPAGSIANATFPEFAAHSTTNTPVKERKRYFWRAVLLTSVAALVPSLIIFAFAKEILTVWISREFADGVSSDILRLLAVGLVANAAAYIPFAFIQAVGRADITAKFHLVELALFVPALLYALQAFGVIGAAMIWLGRVVIDSLLLFAYAVRRLE